MSRVPVEALLPQVERPSRYLGRELNSVRKAEGEAEVRAALAFPDLYEVGMSHLGTHLLYALGNRVPGAAVERVFLPAGDMLAALARGRLPLFTLESKTPLAECDLLGITLQSELTYTNVLTLLDAGGVPLRAGARGESDPIVIGGGPCAYNPEPLADFFDLFFLGEAEDAWPAMLAALRDAKRAGKDRAGRLSALKAFAGTCDPRDAAAGRARPVEKVIFREFERPLPGSAFLVPFLQAVHDRVALEAARGCTRGCRFCHAGMVYRPVRERPADCVLADAERALAATGYEEVSLLSLSIGDYQGLDRFLTSFMDRHAEDKVAVSLPSMRVGTLDLAVADQVARVRRTSFTIAPEAGSERLRRAINKPFTDEEILATARAAFAGGWEAIKLYFMIGLPTETDADLAGIIELVRKTAALAPARGHVTVNLSPFVPKPHTPFQWAAQPEEAELARRLGILRDRLKMKKVQVRWGRTDQAAVEALLARGDRRLGAVIEDAYRAGARMDGWQEHFRYDLWLAALEKNGLTAAFYCNRERGKDEVFPWEHLSCGVSREYLWREWEKARAGEATPDCREAGCTGCGACTPEMKKNIPPLRPAKPLAADAGGGGVGSGLEKSCFPGPSSGPRDPPKPTFRDLTPPDAEATARSPARRIRVTFEKKGELRFLGHLETIHAFERAARRSGLPIAFSRGFSPKPKINFALSLPLGVEAEAEWADLEFTGSIPPAEAGDALNRSLPEGLRVTAAWKAPLDSASLNQRVEGTTWRVEFPAPLDPSTPPGAQGISTSSELGARAAEFAARKTIPVVREKEGRLRDIDLARFLLSLSAPDDRTVLFTLAFSEQGSVRPHEVLEALLGGAVPPGTLLTRTGIILRLEPGKGDRPGLSRVWD